MAVRLLSELVGARVTCSDGRRLGRVSDLAASLAEEYPVVTHLLVRGRWYPWTLVETLEPRPRVRSGEADPRDPNALLLDRHVLDSQIVDIAGRCVRRVADVELAERHGVLRLVAVDVSPAALLRRLGLRRLARHARSESIDWRDLHVVSRPAHGLQLNAAATAVHRLDEEELAALVAHLPPLHADDVLRAVEPRRAAAAKEHSAPASLSIPSRSATCDALAACSLSPRSSDPASSPGSPTTTPRVSQPIRSSVQSTATASCGCSRSQRSRWCSSTSSGHAWVS